MRLGWASRESLVFKMLLPVVIGVGLVGLLGAAYLYLESTRTIEEQALQTARSIAYQVGRDRAQYGRQMESAGLDPMFLHEIGTAVDDRALYRVAMVGLWPISPKHAARDAWERGALERILADPALQPSRVHVVDGQPMLSVVSGETAVAQACVDCHAGQVSAAGARFEVGKPMGALIVDVPLGAALARGRADALRAIAIMLVLLAGIGVVVVVVAGRAVSRPMAALMPTVEPMADGDFSNPVHIASTAELGGIGRALETTRTRMADVLRELTGSVEVVRGASDGLAAQAHVLAAGTQQQASSLEQTAASLEELTSTVHHNAASARQADQLVGEARRRAEDGSAVVRDAVDAMGAIREASSRIRDIITTIDEIAFQTNLLALNAAVEAARAGEQGRSFAVVAAEVRALAGRSATAAREIKALITDAVEKVESGSEHVTRTGEELTGIVRQVQQVADLVREIAAASGEQSHGIEQVSRAVSQMDSVTQRTAAQTEEVNATAVELARQSDELRALVARFRLGAAGDDAAAAPPVADAVTPAPAGPLPRARASIVALPVGRVAPPVPAERPTGTGDRS